LAKKNLFGIGTQKQSAKFMLNVTFLIGMLSVIMLSVIMLSVVILNVLMLSVIMLYVIMLNVAAPIFERK
jgi:hypothetical protein